MLDVPPEDVVLKGRLEPGKMFLVDIEQGRIVDDEELKHSIATAKPYGKWLREYDGAAGRGPRGAPRPRPGPRDAAAPPAGLRLHPGRPQVHPRPDGQQRRGGARLDGDRHPAGRPLRPPAAPLQLLQAALRAGDQPAAGRDPRGAGHLGPHRRRGRGQPADARPRELPPDRARHPDPRQRRAGPAEAARQLAGLQVGHPADALPRRRGGRGAGRGPRSPLRDGDRGDRAGREPAHPHRPRGRRPAGADPLAAGLRGPAPPPGPPGLADSRRADHRVRRRPRGPSLRPPLRLRRRDDQPVRRVRDARRHDHPGDHQAGDRPRRGRLSLPQGDQEGGGQGDVQDGHQHPAELPRGADLRGGRPERGVRRPLLRQDRVADRRRRARGDRPRDALPPLPRLRPPRGRADAPRGGGPVPVAPRGRVPPVQPRDGLPAPARDPVGPLRHLQEVHPGGRRAERAALHAPRPLRLQARRVPSRSRSRRSSRSSRSSSGSPPARCRTARSAARRTRPWPSP